MLLHFYLKGTVIYVPTVAQLTTGAYVDVEPVAIESIAHTEDLRRVFLDTIARKNAVISPLPKGKWPLPVLLKYAKAKSWSAFARGASMWSIEEENGNYRIIGYRDHPDGYWAPDPAQRIDFPPSTTVDAVFDRMIAVLQHAAK